MAARSQHNAEHFFDFPSERFTVGPSDPDELREFIEEDHRLEIDPDIMEIIDLVGFPQITEQHPVGSLGVRRTTPLDQAENLISTRLMESWMFAETLRLGIVESEGPLERGGHQNLFWLVAPRGPLRTMAYWEPRDEKFLVKRHQGAPLERFARVFFRGFPQF